MTGLLYNSPFGAVVTALVVSDPVRDASVAPGHVRVVAWTTTGEGPTPPRDVLSVLSAPTADEGVEAFVPSVAP